MLVRYSEGPAYDPETLNFLRSVLDQAYQELGRKNGPFAAKANIKSVRTILAQRIFSRAALGERNSARLCLYALNGL